MLDSNEINRTNASIQDFNCQCRC